MGKTVWVGGCQSWYLDADGDPAMWPYSWEQWVKELEEPVLDDFLQGVPVRTAPAEIAPLQPAEKAA
jgi:S-formylglutathione hydrolase FrmB